MPDPQQGSRPFVLIPWGADFSSELAGLALQELRANAGASRPDAHLADMSSMLVVFPLRRAAKSLQRALFERPDVPKPFLPPQTATYAGLVSRLGVRLPGPDGSVRRVKVISLLDRASLLFECVRDVSRDAMGPLAGLQIEHLGDFFPWGARLARLLEEIFFNGREPANLAHLQGELPDFPAALVGGLGAIHRKYVAQLEHRGWTTPGLDAQRLFQALQGPDRDMVLSMVGAKRVILAGLFDPPGVEEALCHALWRHAGGLAVLYGDAALAGASGPAHWSCAPMADLAKRWSTSIELAPERETRQARQPVFYEGFDLHSQLHVLADFLRSEPACPEAGDTLIVLPDAQALAPVLHNLPSKDVNVGMGYPLSRSPLARLADSLFRAQEASRGGADGVQLYYWKDCVECLRHPYLKMLQTAGGQPLRIVFRHLEERLRQGDRMVDPAEVLRCMDLQNELQLDAASAEELRRLAERALDACFAGFSGLDNLAAAGESLARLCGVMLEHAADSWNRFPLDAECLHRLLFSVIPMLRDSGASAFALGQATVRNVVRQCVEDETAPFASESMEGLQLLSPGETRLARFRRVFVLDAVDSRFPGRPGEDPLLPDPLRRLAGLPDSFNREAASAWALFGLIKGAEQSVLLYQAGVQSGGELLDAKPERSRFVEELLWDAEQQLGRVIAPGDALLPQVVYPLRAIPDAGEPIERTPEAERRLSKVLDTPVSASLLDLYMLCPAKFYYERIAKLEEPQQADEDGDPAALGNVAHTALQQFFQPWLGRQVDGSLLQPEELAQTFRELLHEQPFFLSMDLDSRLVLEHSACRRLRSYAAGLAPTRILEQESILRCQWNSEACVCSLTGKLDRIDARASDAPGEEHICILDYKTGTPRKPKANFWSDNELWERMETWRADNDPELLEEVAASCQSVQMPLYMLLYWRSRGLQAHNAGWVALKDAGKEQFLLPADCLPDERNWLLEERIPALIDFLLRHMHESATFAPAPSRRCEWCAYARLCGQ